jgi:small-conductance mechanosensitive channel
MASSLGLLIAPSMQHRLVEDGQDTQRMQRATNLFAALALIPFALSLGITFYIVLERHAGAAIAAAAGAAFSVAALFFWFAIERMIKQPEEKMNGEKDEKQTPLHTRIEQMLTESRVMLPGAQALLGFQFAVMLSKSFDQLPSSARAVHVAALAFLALAVILLMTPAAIHRIAEPMSVSERFLWMASNLLLAGMMSLALGVALDVFVVTTALTGSNAIGVVVGLVALVVFFAFWLVVPRRERDRHA